MDAAKLKKREEYASIRGKKGAQEEKSGEYMEAVPTYLRLVDVLLAMSEASPGYSYLVRCTAVPKTIKKRSDR